MANYTSLGTYEARSLIPEFRGLAQGSDDINGDPRYAAEAENFETVDGTLQPAAVPILLGAELPKPIETLAVLHRRWYIGDESVRDVLVAASDGKLYAMAGEQPNWTALAFPDGITQYQSNDWSWVTYEINPEGAENPIDVLLLSNALDGMVMVRGDTFAVTTVPAPKKFGIITRYAERIWGGAIIDDPDMLVYSAPYDPTDWTANIEHPEDGAGDIQQPSWDGDGFTSLMQFGAQLIAFKRTRVWRVMGTDPGEYIFKEQYGGGAPYARTIALNGEAILLLTDEGVAVYDGLTVHPFQQEMCRNIFQRMNKAALEQATACEYRGRYYLALPLDGSATNNAVLVFNAREGTWLLRTDIHVENFLPTEKALYFTTVESPGLYWRWQDDSWRIKQPTAAAARWVGPWQDFNNKNINKGGFDVYFLGEVRTEPVTVKVSIQTEKKTKTKTYTIQPVTRLGASPRQKRLHFGGTGRRWRIILESLPGTPPWRLTTGVQILTEIDPD